MLSLSSKSNETGSTPRVNTDTYNEARCWIGRRLVLQKPLLQFRPGTSCIVMCVVDFGDGPLLWIVTDDKLAIEVDQLELTLVCDYFKENKYEKTGQAANESVLVHTN